MNNLTIKKMRQLFTEKKLSPLEVFEEYLARIEKHTDSHIFIAINADQARKQAQIATQRYQLGEAHGLLEGIPVAYKDNIYTKNLRTTSGSLIEERFVPDSDAPAVRSMQEAGAINLGKLNLHEYAFGMTSQNPFYGAVQNPWNRSYTPAGSSGGSAAALAADLAMATLGTDTGGSIRVPAAACGVIGLKATRNLIPSSGTRPISWSLDHVGPLTKTVEDMAVVLETLTGNAYSRDLQHPMRGLRVGVPKQFFFDYTHAGVKASYEAALKNLEQLGAVLIEVDVPMMGADIAALFVLAISEGATVHEQRLKEHKDKFGADVIAALTAVEHFSPMDYIKALQRQAELTQQMSELLEYIDVLATPTMAFPVQKIGINEVEVNEQLQDFFTVTTHNSAPFNLTGHPAISLPCGLLERNLPVGLQLVAANYKERLLLQIAYAYETAFLSDFYVERSKLRFV